jgi:hypothetical protein
MMTMTMTQTKGKYAGKNRIVVSREQSFDAIDEWHRSHGHFGQDRTWGYCAEKFYNVTENMVKVYCQTCLTCMKKNPATHNEKGSIKPIRSSRLHIPAGILRIPVFSVPIACFSQESQFLFRSNLVFRNKKEQKPSQ